MNDTIAAVSTAPGRAAISVVRVSGPGAAAIVADLGLGRLDARRATLRHVRHPDGDELLDRALVTWFPAPASYTGEDMLELSAHGGALVPARLLDAVCASGARPAEPGEFTRRAYLNGKLDLLQVEATLDLIDAASPRLQRAALFSLERGMSARVEELRAVAVKLQALLAYDIDFPDEDEGPVDRQSVTSGARDLAARLDRMLELAPEGELLHEGALTVIAGRPNAGKSSLFNALLGVERTIVTEVPGTTRDAVEAAVSIDGYPFRLVDTAGIRASPERVEGMGIEVARAYVERADLVLLCIDPGELGNPEELEEPLATFADTGCGRMLTMFTKADAYSGFVRSTAGADLVVSAHTGEGLPELKERMLESVFQGLRRAPPEAPLVTRARQARALGRARRAVSGFLESWEEDQPPEIAVTHLQDAVVCLEEMLGVVTGEDVLDALFSEFCIGK